MFRSLCRLDVDDGILFDSARIGGSEIRKNAGYTGIRIELKATLDGARLALQVDIGFGDAVTPMPVTVLYPVLLDDLPRPELRAYPKYTVVAEKFHVLCTLGLANSRMKDYFDLWVLLRDEDLDASELTRAVTATFERRKTSLPETLPVGLSDEFIQDPGKQTQWRAFLKRNRLDPLALGEVITVLRAGFESANLIPQR